MFLGPILLNAKSTIAEDCTFVTYNASRPKSFKIYDRRFIGFVINDLN